MSGSGGTDRLNAKAKASRARDAKKARGLLALIARRKSVIQEAFYDVGLALRELLDGKLYVALELPSFDAMLAEHRIMSGVQARKLVAITREVGRESALTMGIEKAYAMVRYVDETTEADTVEGLLASDAPIGKTSATRAKAVEVEDATRALRARNAKSTKKAPATPAAREKAALVRMLRTHLAKLGLTRPEVSVGKDRVTIELTRRAVERLADR